MGSGPARELGGPGGPVKALSPTLAARLTAAVQRLDKLDPQFKQARDDERMGQLAKAWGGACTEIDAHLRAVAQVLIFSHQISLDMGSEGGGRGAMPWIEETGYKFKRLYFRLEDDGTVVAVAADRTIASAPDLAAISYDWVEQTVVDWVVSSIETIR